MALKALMLRKRIDTKKNELEELRGKDAEFQAREAGLERSIEEAQTEEEKNAVSEAIDAFEAEKAEHENGKDALSREIDGLENELAEVERNQSVPQPAPAENKTENIERNNVKMENRTKFFGMDMNQRDAFMAREDVKEFLTRTRAMSAQARSVSGADLLIPDVMLDILRDEVAKRSRLLPFVRLRRVGGTARQNITGEIPEGVWTEACASLNDLNITFNQVEVDGYKVGGYIAICNATLQDSDLNLATEIVNALAGSIAKAVDKAILFGNGTKMPIGIATRLAQTSQPASWGTNAPAWTDLHTSNIKKLNIFSSTGTAFFVALIEALSVAKPKYNADGLFWVMNRKTHLDILAKALNFNAAGALVAGINDMPIVGGTIVEFEDNEISDYEIIGGFGGNYLMAERAGVTLANSDQVFFLQDQTAFKGTARYDGVPVGGEAFVIVNYNNQDATTSKTFSVDYANTAMNSLTVTAAAGAATGDTVLTVSNSVAQSSQVYKYAAKKRLSALNFKTGDKLPASGWTALTSGTTQITAAAGVPIVVVELDGNSRIVSVGEVVSVPKT